MVKKDECPDILCLVHRQEVPLILSKHLAAFLHLLCSLLDGECELEDMNLNDAEHSQGHQGRFQVPGGVFIVLSGTEASDGDISEEVAVYNEVAEDVTKGESAAGDEFEPEEYVEILEVCASLGHQASVGEQDQDVSEEHGQETAEHDEDDPDGVDRVPPFADHQVTAGVFGQVGRGGGGGAKEVAGAGSHDGNMQTCSRRISNIFRMHRIRLTNLTTSNDNVSFEDTSRDAAASQSL